ncbi:MAG: hypothetical protein ABH843_00390 [Candidatus Omnitrophota bacterium]
MRGFKFTIALIVVSVFLCSALNSTAGQDWDELSSEHFIIYFTKDEKFAKNVLDKAEAYYRDIALELGYPRYSEFWMWAKRAKIYVYPDHNSYLKATGEAGWTHGIAVYKKKSIISYAWGKDFVESLLPHEMGHLIFREFVGFKGEIPLWLDEGVAQWSEKDKRKEMKSMAMDYYLESKFLLLGDMMTLDVNALSKNELLELIMRPTKTPDDKDAILIITTDELVTTYYLQGVSLVGFLIEMYGSNRFAEFCRQLRDGKDLEEALKFAYPTKIRNLEEFETSWRKYLSRLLIT